MNFKIFTIIFIVFSIHLNGNAQSQIQDSLEINKDWWNRMTIKYPGFHGTYQRWMANGDFNKDGKVDLVIAFAKIAYDKKYYEDYVFKGVFINNGSNYFKLDTNLVFKFIGGDDGHLVLDINGDGFLDVFQPTDCDAAISGLLNPIPKYYWRTDPENPNSNWAMGEFLFINNMNKSFSNQYYDKTQGSTTWYIKVDIDKDGDEELAFKDLSDYDHNNKKTQIQRDTIQLFDFKNDSLTRKMLFRRDAKNIWNSGIRWSCPLFSENDTLICLSRDYTPDNINYLFSVTNNKEELISKIEFPSSLNIKPFHNSGQQGIRRDLDKDGKPEYIISFWNQNSENNYILIFNSDGKEQTNKFFNDSINWKIGKIDLGVSDIYDDLNDDGFIDIIPNRGFGFKYNNQYSFFRYNPQLQKFEIKTLHKFNIEKPDIGYMSDYDYKTHTAIAQEFKVSNPTLDTLFLGIKTYNMRNAYSMVNCNNLVKPAFNTTKYSFCMGDSLKISITNVNKGDTLKWYFGTKSDLTNVANKTFTDSSKVFVTKTDSLGCMISSDTIQLKKYPIPSSPNLSRDADNNLVSNSIGNIWYKDGVKISDTTQKIKPTSNGIYTATTTQNGCTSSISQGYYYLTNAVSNLSDGEYFKISPNPTSGELNINYKFSSTKDIYISVIDINGRNVILNKKITSGSKINIGGAAKGNYILQVKDKTGRLITSQKVVKE